MTHPQSVRSRLTRKARCIAAIALTVAAVTATAAPASAQFNEPPPDDHIVIDLVTINGSGCPADTAEVATSSDNTAFTVTYNAFIAEVGPTSNPINSRKNCQLNVLVHVPQGFTYAIAKADYRGYGGLSAGAHAIHKSTYYFQGDSRNTTSTHRINGSLNDNWQVTDQVAIAALIFAPCGEQKNFNINTELRVVKGTSPSTATSFITMDSTDGSVSTEYHFHWRRC